MDERACMSKQLKWNWFPFMVTDCLGKISRGLTSPDSVSEKITQVEKSDRLSEEITLNK